MAAIPFMLKIDPQLMAAIDAEAAFEDRSAADVLLHAVRDYIARKEGFRKYLDDLVAEAGKGVFVSDHKATSWFLSLGSDSELPEPEPDIFPKPARP